jgi:hypothetical protein
VPLLETSLDTVKVPGVELELSIGDSDLLRSTVV